MSKIAFLSLVSAVAAASSCFGDVVYQQTSTTGLTYNTTESAAVLDDVTFSSSQAGNILSNLTLFYGVPAGATAQSARVYVNFYDTINPFSTGAVESGFLGGFNAAFTAKGNFFSGEFFYLLQLNNLESLGITFTDSDVGVFVAFTDAAGAQLSTVLTPISSVPGAPTIGSSFEGLYRNSNNSDDFEATELDPSQGNLYLQISTVPGAVPEPSTLALLGAGSVLGAWFYLRRARRKS